MWPNVNYFLSSIDYVNGRTQLTITNQTFSILHISSFYNTNMYVLPAVTNETLTTMMQQNANYHKESINPMYINKPYCRREPITT